MSRAGGIPGVQPGEDVKAEGCPCGHTDDQAQAALMAHPGSPGATVTVHHPEGAWRVPQAYIALHGLPLEILPAIADYYGFEPVTGTAGGPP